jgi:hypothetical protein
LDLTFASGTSGLVGGECQIRSARTFYDILCPIRYPIWHQIRWLGGRSRRRRWSSSKSSPPRFSAACREDFATCAPTSSSDLLGLFQGVGLPFRSESAPVQMPNMIWLYRRPILDYWAEHDETLGAIVKHVLVHEIGHHFGLSDADMMAIEATADEAKGTVS